MTQQADLVEIFSQKAVQKFIEKNKNDDTKTLALKYNGKVEFDLPLVLNQIDLLKKAKIKLPTFFQKNAIFTSKSQEQATSENVALFKKEIISGKKLLDLTAGLGVDAWALSNSFDEITLLEPNVNRFEILKHNFSKLTIKNAQYINQTAENFLENNSEQFDVIYLDPDRRKKIIDEQLLKDNKKSKKIRLENYSPNVLDLLDNLFEIAPKIYLKTSPMLDIDLAIRQLKSVHQVFVIAEKNEVKEILFELKINQNKSIKISAININQKKVQKFSGIFKKQIKLDLEENALYFYEPNLSIIKSNLTAQYAQNKDLKQISQNSNYLLGNEFLEDFQGRKFKIIEKLSYKKKEIKKWLKTQKIKKANIAKRNFFWSVAEIRQQLNLKDGGEWFLFFTKNENGNGICYACKI